MLDPLKDKLRSFVERKPHQRSELEARKIYECIGQIELAKAIMEYMDGKPEKLNQLLND